MLKERTLIIIGMVLIFIYLLPLFILGEDAHVRIHDNLDSNVVWYKTLVESGLMFAPNDAAIPTMMNGLPRAALDSELSLYVLLFLLFEPFTVFALNLFLMRFIAFFGMYLLLKKHIFKNYRTSPLIIVGTATAFALTPFWPFGGLSLAGIPLALYAFLNLRNRTATWKDWLILALMPFYSIFVFSFIFFLGILGLVWLYDVVKKKTINWTFIAGIALMTSIFLIKQYRLVTGVLLGQGFTPHREDFNRGHRTLQGTMEFFGENFFTAHSHSDSMHWPFIVIAVFSALVLVCVKVIMDKKRNGIISLNAHEKSVPFFLVVITIFSLWISFWNYQGFLPVKQAVDIIKTFNFARFHLLNTIIWYVLFAVSLTIIRNRFKFKWINVLILLLIIGQLAVLTSEHHEFKYRDLGYPSYEEFYSESLFDEIKSYIGEDPSDYRVVSIGMHPSVAQYNGMHTLDMYVTMYPLAYKEEFRGIVEGELDKNKSLENYYNRWAGRVYVYTDELEKKYLFTKDKNKKIKDLDFGTERFKEMGGKYVLSAVEIENADESDLQLLEEFENNESGWRIYLYEAE
ncbi:DUF6044 family protein [Alteribacillus sp. HJP-4]|uniref:DUF6044 family protein n=1 Tax=Alteribacillus sp. HJP-4 TaxID=2775394 RepID=UPI0035CCCB82